MAPIIPRPQYKDAWSLAEFWRTHIAEPCMVYVIGSGDAVKVGKANNPYERVAGLQTGNPVKLGLLRILPGDHELEARLHRWLKPDWIHGEWFEGSTVPDVLEFLDELIDKQINAWDGSAIQPDWKGLMTWPRHALKQDYRKKREHAPVTVRRVDPASLAR